MTIEEDVSLVTWDKDSHIRNLELRIAEKDARILELTSQLDKYKSIFRYTAILAPVPAQNDLPQNGLAQNDPAPQAGSDRKNQRAWGISAEPSSNSQALPLPSKPKRGSKEQSAKTRELIRQALLEDEFLQSLDSIQIREIINCMHSVDFMPDSFVINEGDVGSLLYVLEDGELEVSKAGHTLCTMGPGKAFGELAILYNCTRTATVKSVTSCRLWAIDRTTFQSIMMRTGIQRHRQYTEFLSSVPIFQSLSSETINRIADVLDEVHYDNGSYIVRQYARGDTFYIISKGKVKVTRSEPGHREELFIRILNAGDFFGERALESEDVRTANIIACDHEGVDCLILERDAYVKLISKIDAVHRSYEELENTDCELEVPRELVDAQLSNFITLATLGVGGFGRVTLVQMEGDSSRTYAMKKLKKQHIVETRQQEHILNEKHVMCEIRCDFIVRLYKTYKDKKYLYMIMEAALGGELWTILRDRGVFDESSARFYAACIIEALYYLHARGIIYRDLKPENVLLDENGYAKLVDFGFAKKIGRGWKTWTFCGTPEYVAPEVILNKGHDLSADLWSLGIFIYELLTGTPPFTQPDPRKLYSSILRGIDAVDFPRAVSKQSRHVIKNLCRENPHERLGHGSHGLSDLQKHKWFDGFNWDGIRNRTHIAPYVPQIKHCADASNFDPYPEDTIDPIDVLTNWDEDF